MAMAGLDAPVTLAGTLLLQNCYNWIGNVVAYLWGAAGSWGGGAHAVDMRSHAVLVRLAQSGAAGAGRRRSWGSGMAFSPA